MDPDQVNDSLQWGVRAVPGPHGLTLRGINVGIYGDIPEESRDMTRRPRGAMPNPNLPRLDNYSINHKNELWADNAVDLYEESVQRRWLVEEDIPWTTVEPLDENLELAICQFCTELCHQASVEIDTLGQWLHKMNYSYHEVKVFLATQAFDAARHYEVFSKRAVYNGGCLGHESVGIVNRRIIECRSGWTETALYLYFLRGSLTTLLYRYGELYSKNPAEKLFFRLCLQDKSRHVAYGMAHVKYAIDSKGEDYSESLLRFISSAETDIALEFQDPILWEALAIIFGGGIDKISDGMRIVRGLKERYVSEYMKRMRWVGIDKTEDNLALD
ncbi:uncharacterized protein METZ01_LOCUS254350, partial [marine metagenome]